ATQHIETLSLHDALPIYFVGSMPKKVDHKERREAFLAAAYRTIKKKGIDGVTIRAVAREAGFTTGALVHYVDSKDKLLVQASERSEEHTSELQSPYDLVC